VDISTLTEAYNAAVDDLEKFSSEYDGLAADADEDTIATAKTNLDNALARADETKAALKHAESVKTAREQHSKVEFVADDKPLGPITVNEPDMYSKENGSFLKDLYASQLKNDPAATDRISKHQAYEVEKYAISSSTVGGIIPPQYLVDMYAKASRNGRVAADQVNHQTLPDVGMSVIIPRLTQGLSAAAQSSENSAVSTQDVTETDLTVNVNTIGGYSPVSRQTLERAAYSEAILFEDLIARYWAALDTDVINGSGSSGHCTGILNTSSIKTSTVTTQTVAGAWPKFADVIQQINAATGGLGYVADKIIVHPRRWGFFEAGLDSNNRPVFGITGSPYFNIAGEGSAQGYGLVGNIMGLPVYTDANVPTNLGAGTNEDWAIVLASQVCHLWERDNDPVMLSFEQQAGTSLQVQLVGYGYSAFTAGRYPAAVGVVKGMTTPSF
jgi:HK97 family phage major capsid protein